MTTLQISTAKHPKSGLNCNWQACKFQLHIKQQQYDKYGFKLKYAVITKHDIAIRSENLNDKAND